jgi:hypothetical protein
LQGRHVALHNGSHATDRSAKVLLYANKMRPIRSSCATLTTNTNWFAQSNPFVIFILFFFSPSSLLLIYSVYILRVCRISMLCLLSLLSLMQRCIHTLYTHPTATVWMLVCVDTYFTEWKRESAWQQPTNNSQQPRRMGFVVGWENTDCWRTVLLREACLLPCTHTQTQQKLRVALVFHRCMKGFVRSSRRSDRASWQVLILLAMV